MAWVFIVGGLVHTAATAVSFPAASAAAAWFLGSGLALVYLGLGRAGTPLRALARARRQRFGPRVRAVRAQPAAAGAAVLRGGAVCGGSLRGRPRQPGFGGASRFGIRGLMAGSSSRAALWFVLACLLPSCGSGPEPESAAGPGDAFAERVAAEHAEDLPVASGAAAVEGSVPVVAEKVAYGSVDGRPIHGYLARPEAAKGPLAGLIVIHEWWGLNDNIRAMTQRLAGEGYAALAVDLYDGQVADEAVLARQLAGAAQENAPALRDNLRQARAYLVSRSGAPRVGTIGWCFGGGWSLDTALTLGADVDAAVIYYGRLVTDPERLGRLQAPVLGIFGSNDRAIPVASVREFEAVLGRLGKPAEIHVYEGADHAFANPSGTRYNAEAAGDAWKRTTAFFREHLH